jgi:hypothetical protein
MGMTMTMPRSFVTHSTLCQVKNGVIPTPEWVNPLSLSLCQGYHPGIMKTTGTVLQWGSQLTAGGALTPEKVERP